MRKKTLLLGFALFVFCAPVLYGIEGNNLDLRLKALLANETVPFFPDSVRREFLTLGMNQCGMMCEHVTCVKISSYLLAGKFALGYGTHVGAQAILGAHAIHNVDDGYALRRIHPKDIARKKIATDAPAQYWYNRTTSGTRKEFGVYPPVIDSTNFAMYLHGMPGWPDSANLHPAFENEVVLWALYLCKKRLGETQIAEFIRKIAENEILDLKIILQNRPIDVIREKEVVP
jgi:hypothetical protein